MLPLDLQGIAVEALIRVMICPGRAHSVCDNRVGDRSFRAEHLVAPSSCSTYLVETRCWNMLARRGASTEELVGHFENIRSTLLRKAAEAGLARNPTLIGTSRELVLSEVLSANLPQSVSFPTGEIIDPRGQRSGQLDMIIVPDAAPRLSIGADKVIGLAGAVAGVLEVKSTLTVSPPSRESELTHAVRGCERMKKLDPGRLETWPWREYRGGGGKAKLATIPFSLLAFEGPPAAGLLTKMEDWEDIVAKKHLPNTITVLNRGYTLVLNDGWLSDPNELRGPREVYLESGPGMSLAILFFFWTTCVQAWIAKIPYTPFPDYLEMTLNRVTRRTARRRGRQL
jgi:hypothetical protein